MRGIFIAPLAVFFIIIVAMSFKLFDSGDKVADVIVGQKLPEFNLPAIYGDVPGIVNTDLKGGYSLLNIFASWCVSCKIEHPFLMRLKESNILPIYGIAWKDNREKLSKWLSSRGNPYDAIGADDTGKTIIDLGVTGAPETFLISPEGVVLVRYAGALNSDIWKDKFLPIIEKK